MRTQAFVSVARRARPVVRRGSQLSPPFLNSLFLWLAEKYLRLTYQKCHLSYKGLGGAPRADFLYPLTLFITLIKRIPNSLRLLENLFCHCPQSEVLECALSSFLRGYEIQREVADAWHKKDIPDGAAQRLMVSYLCGYLTAPLDTLHSWCCMPQASVIREEIIASTADKEGDILEIGCAHNPLVNYYKSKGFFVGYDLSYLSLRIGQILEETNSGHLVCGDACELPFRDSSFDICIASHVLEHTTEPEQAVSEINRVLRSDGIAIIIVPVHMLHLGAGLLTDKEFAKVSEDHRGSFYSHEELVKVFEAHGLLVEEARGSFFKLHSTRLKQGLRQPSNSSKLEDILCCPICKGSVVLQEGTITCSQCHRKYGLKKDIPIMIRQELVPEFLSDKEPPC